MPLCEKNYTGGTFGERLHNGSMNFIARYGKQDEMIAEARKSSAAGDLDTSKIR